MNGIDRNETVFVLLGEDPGAGQGPPANRRLVCLVQGGGKLAVWGRDGNTAHIDAIKAAGFPCSVACHTTNVPEWAYEKYEHTHWLEENAYMRIL